MKRFDSRLKRLELSASKSVARRLDEEEAPPRAAGKPREIVQCEYIAWLRRKFDNPSTMPAELESLPRRIEKVRESLEASLHGMRRKRASAALNDFDLEVLETAERMLRGEAVPKWPVGKVSGAWRVEVPDE